MFYHYFPHGTFPIPSDHGKQKQLPKVPGWNEYDDQNYRDVESAMSEGKELDFAHCQWLMQQEDNEAVLAVAFPDDKWLTWYEYAIDHCQRFAKTQPKR